MCIHKVINKNFIYIRLLTFGDIDITKNFGRCFVISFSFYEAFYYANANFSDFFLALYFLMYSLW